MMGSKGRLLLTKLFRMLLLLQARDGREGLRQQKRLLLLLLCRKRHGALLRLAHERTADRVAQRREHGRVGSVCVVLGVVLLLQKARPLILLLLAVLLLLRRRVRVDVQNRKRGDTDGRSVVVAEREMIVVSGSIGMVAVVESTTGESIRFATFF